MKGLWSVVVVIVFLAVMMSGVALQSDRVAEVDNATESQTLASDEWTTLNEEDRVIRLYQNETVTDSNGTVLERGTDYEMDYEQSQIRAVDNSSADGETVTVEYAFDTADTDTRDILALLSAFSPLLGQFMLVCAGTVLLLWFGRLVGVV
jgi:ABC-type uncharacterized transport system auxiliary subunit